MYCNPIRQSHTPEYTIAELRDFSPEANSGVALNFNPGTLIL